MNYLFNSLFLVYTYQQVLDPLGWIQDLDIKRNLSKRKRIIEDLWKNEEWIIHDHDVNMYYFRNHLFNN